MGESVLKVLTNRALFRYITSYQNGTRWKDWKLCDVCKQGWLNFLISVFENDPRWTCQTKDRFGQNEGAIDYAAWGGHLHVLEWLQARGDKRLPVSAATPRAVDFAA